MATPTGNKEPPKDEKSSKKPIPDLPLTKEGFKEFFSEHKWDAFSYLVLFIGLLITAIFDRFIGGILVGLVLGMYFSQDIHHKFSFFKEYLDQRGIFRSFVLLAAIIALLLASPGLCIGTAIGAFLRPYLGESISSPFDNE